MPQGRRTISEPDLFAGLGVNGHSLELKFKHRGRRSRDDSIRPAVVEPVDHRQDHEVISSTRVPRQGLPIVKRSSPIFASGKSDSRASSASSSSINSEPVPRSNRTDILRKRLIKLHKSPTPNNFGAFSQLGLKHDDAKKKVQEAPPKQKPAIRRSPSETVIQFQCVPPTTVPPRRQSTASINALLNANAPIAASVIAKRMPPSIYDFLGECPEAACPVHFPSLSKPSAFIRPASAKSGRLHYADQTTNPSLNKDAMDILQNSGDQGQNIAAADDDDLNRILAEYFNAEPRKAPSPMPNSSPANVSEIFQNSAFANPKKANGFEGSARFDVPKAGSNSISAQMELLDSAIERNKLLESSHRRASLTSTMRDVSSNQQVESNRNSGPSSVDRLLNELFESSKQAHRAGLCNSATSATLAVYSRLSSGRGDTMPTWDWKTNAEVSADSHASAISPNNSGTNDSGGDVGHNMAATPNLTAESGPNIDGSGLSVNTESPTSNDRRSTAKIEEVRSPKTSANVDSRNENEVKDTSPFSLKPASDTGLAPGPITERTNQSPANECSQQSLRPTTESFGVKTSARLLDPSSHLQRLQNSRAEPSIQPDKSNTISLASSVSTSASLRQHEASDIFDKSGFDNTSGLNQATQSKHEKPRVVESPPLSGKVPQSHDSHKGQARKPEAVELELSRRTPSAPELLHKVNGSVEIGYAQAKPSDDLAAAKKLDSSAKRQSTSQEEQLDENWLASHLGFSKGSGHFLHGSQDSGSTRPSGASKRHSVTSTGVLSDKLHGFLATQSYNSRAASLVARDIIQGILQSFAASEHGIHSPTKASDKPKPVDTVPANAVVESALQKVSVANANDERVHDLLKGDQLVANEEEPMHIGDDNNNAASSGLDSAKYNRILNFLDNIESADADDERLTHVLGLASARESSRSSNSSQSQSLPTPEYNVIDLLQNLVEEKHALSELCIQVLIRMQETALKLTKIEQRQEKSLQTLQRHSELQRLSRTATRRTESKNSRNKNNAVSLQKLQPNSVQNNEQAHQQNNHRNSSKGKRHETVGVPASAAVAIQTEERVFLFGK